MNTSKYVPLKSKSGFTIVELMLAIALLTIVLTIAYQTISYIYDTYRRSEEKNIAQEDVQNISNWIFSNLQGAYGVDLYSDKDDLDFSSTNDHYFLYNDSNDGKIYLRNPKASSGTVIINVPLKIEFSFKTATPKALDFSVRKLKDNNVSTELYRQNSTITFPNMLLAAEINQPDKNGNASSPRTPNTVSEGTAISFYLADAAGIADLLS